MAMNTRRLELSALDRLDLGDGDMLGVHIDLRRGEARIAFGAVGLTDRGAATGSTSRVELDDLVLVLTGFRSMVSSPTSSRPEAIVLKWSIDAGPGVAVAELLVVGDPEPVKLRFECEAIHAEV